MKKIIALILTLLMIIALSACTANDIPNIESEEPIVSAEFEIESQEPEPIPEISLNYDILTDFGQTFDDVKARRGLSYATHRGFFGSYEPPPAYRFENGYGLYEFRDYHVVSSACGTIIHLNNKFLMSTFSITARELFVDFEGAHSPDAIRRAIEAEWGDDDFIRINYDENTFVLWFFNDLMTPIVTSETEIRISLCRDSWWRIVEQNRINE